MSVRVMKPHGGKRGPVHRIQDDSYDGLTWCGVGPQFRHMVVDGEADDITCSKCIRQIKQDRPLARGGS